MRQQHAQVETVSHQISVKSVHTQGGEPFGSLAADGVSGCVADEQTSCIEIAPDLVLRSSRVVAKASVPAVHSGSS